MRIKILAKKLLAQCEMPTRTNLQIKKRNGHIDLCELLGVPKKKYLKKANQYRTIEDKKGFKELHDNLKKVPHVNVIKCRVKSYSDDDFCHWSKLVFTFSLNGETYYFKYDSETLNYYELIIEEICHIYNIDCVDYQLAQLGNCHGVISKDFKDPEAHYISGFTLLKEAGYLDNSNIADSFDEDEMDAGLDENQLRKKHNNLESIWYAIEKRYKDRPNGQEIVEKLMSKIVDMFIIDLIFAQCDRHCENWQIVEYKDGKVDLQAVYDNDRIMMNSPSESWLAMTAKPSEEIDEEPLKTNIEYFMKNSSSEFIDLFLNRLSILEEGNIEEVFRKITTKIGCSIPKTIKINFLNKCRTQLDYIMNIIDDKKNKK